MFQTIGLVAVGVGVLFLVLSPYLKRLAHGDIIEVNAPELDGERQAMPHN